MTIKNTKTVTFKTRIKDGIIECLFDTKWRAVRRYQGKKFPPGQKIMNEVKETMLLNTGFKRMAERENINLIVEFDWSE